MTSVSPSSPTSPQKPAQEEKNNPYTSRNKEDANRLELISLARKTFSELMFTAYSEENLPKLEARYSSILKENVEEAKKFNNVNDIAHLVFARYLDVEIEAALPLIHQQIPALDKLSDIDDELRAKLRIRAHMLHSIAMEEPITKAIKEVFKDRNFGDVKLDLRRQL